MKNSCEKKWKPDVERAWQAFCAHAEEEALMPVEEEQKPSLDRTTKRKITTSFVVWSAAILCVLCFGLTSLFWDSLFGGMSKMITIQSMRNNEALVATLPDGSVVLLSDGGELTYPSSFAKSQRKVWLAGEAFFEVVNDQKRTFVVETEYITTEVLGTSFRIRAHSNRPFELTVVNGVVKATLHNEHHEVFVEGGERVQLVANWLQKSYVEDIEPLHRSIRRLFFKDETLGRIIHVLNECAHGAMLLAIEDELLAKRVVTVTLNIENRERIAEILCNALNLEKTIENDVIYLTLK